MKKIVKAVKADPVVFSLLAVGAAAGLAPDVTHWHPSAIVTIVASFSMTAVFVAAGALGGEKK